MFAGVAAQISHAPRLEDIQEVADFIKNNVVPQRGRKLHVEVLNSVYDFRKWMAPFDMSIAGVVSTKTQPEAAHLWRFVPRSFIKLAGLTDAAVEITHPDWSGFEPNEEDTIILVKQFMADTKYCQQPVLLMPTQIASRLDPSDLQVHDDDDDDDDENDDDDDDDDDDDGGGGGSGGGGDDDDDDCRLS